MDPSIFDSPALPLLQELEQGGFQMRLIDEERVHVEPGSRLTADQRQRLMAYKSAIVMLLRCCDQGVVERRDVFRRQLHATVAPGVPTFLFRSDVVYVPALCFSCGERTDRRGYGRCWRCSLAWRLACRLSVPTDVATAIDGARQIA